MEDRKKIIYQVLEEVLENLAFLFFVPEEREQAKLSFDAFRESCETTPACRMAEQDIFVSYRFAVIDLAGARESVKALLARAERALREVKGQGSPRA